MKKIASFQINHDVLKPGIYTSRIDGDVITYDIRMAYPNSGKYLDNDEMHTFEHLFATYVRNTAYSDAILYIGPMGCRTGFYFLTRDSLSPETVIALVRETLGFIAGFEGDVPGASPAECGNAAEHDLTKAKKLAARMTDVLKNWTVNQLEYEK
jgi:S-ribosylhomocysteine lyase